ncbi:YqiA/YcfP family alpha/beta fold hydrolase [Candidatus Cyanaurora vandensis]|uniref:YqiA/YcfP family alpha/beta fold hydrolase n=1 Tax=Candidatus Cyanaurora vandensis TaxID=2714958 RepID=UPI00257CB407|nr:YqiA/YcfP family alpha/beta fold hydrolase [Candidatus Cyanaurora vandensis]
MRYLYLHGLASGPSSSKGRYFAQLLQDLGQELSCPDLNWPEFQTMTLTSQLQRVQQELGQDPGPVTLLGSSLGGLVAVLTAIQDSRIVRLCLMAPALGFLASWSEQLGPVILTQWQQTGYLPLYHYAYQRQMELGYAIIPDSAQYNEEKLTRPLPILIFHGRRDAVVSFAVSSQFAKTRPWVQLELLESDHQLTDVLAYLGSTFVQWLDSSPV